MTISISSLLSTWADENMTIVFRIFLYISFVCKFKYFHSFLFIFLLIYTFGTNFEPISEQNPKYHNKVYFHKILNSSLTRISLDYVLQEMWLLDLKVDSERVSLSSALEDRKRMVYLMSAKESYKRCDWDQYVGSKEAEV